MTKVKVFVYGRRQQQRQQRQQRRGYDNSSPDFRHGELKMQCEILYENPTFSCFDATAKAKDF